jgi:hypothetical protein
MHTRETIPGRLRRRGWVSFLAICVGFVGPLASVHAATYYVRRSGSDSNSGTSATRAWRTLSKAATTVVAGDRVYVGAGVYSEAVTPRNSGTAANPIRYIADSLGTFTGDAGNVIVSGPAGADGFLVNGKNYIQITGFRVSGCPDGIEWRGGAVGGQLQNCEFYSNTVGLRINGARVTASNCIVRNNKDYGVVVQGNSVGAIAQSSVYSNSKDGVRLEGSQVNYDLTAVRIHSNGSPLVFESRGVYCNAATCRMVNCLVYLNNNRGVWVETGNPNMTIDNCTISQNTREGVLQNHGTVTIRNTIVAFSSGTGLNRVGGAMNHTYNLIFGSGSVDLQGTTAGTGELFVDPLFVSDTDMHLQDRSPAINKGTTITGITTDLDGNTRPIGAGFDMGAYENVTGGNPPGVRVLSWIEIP